MSDFFAKIVQKPSKKVFSEKKSVLLHPEKIKMMPEISSFYGIVIYMYISDHQPPHFHVKYNEYECWITIEDGVITGKLPRRAIQLVYEWLDLHKNELLNNWNRLQNSEAPMKIVPLI